MQRKWVLEGYFGADGQSLQRMPLKQFPANDKFGSRPTLAIVRSEISRVHAEFFEKSGELYLRDLNSTNGTFINHQPLVGEMSLRHGDVVHFASYEVRVLEEVNQDMNDSSMTMMKVMPLSNKLPTGLHELQMLLDERAIRADFQPIVTLDGSLFG